MHHTELLAQAVGTIGAALMILWPLAKNRTIQLAMQVGGSVSFIVHFALLGAITAAGMCVLSAVQSAVLLPQQRRWWSVAAFLATLAGIVGLTVLTWAGTPSIFASVGLAFQALSRWSLARPLTLASYGAAALTWTIHDALIGSYPGLVTDAMAILTVVAGLLGADPARLLHSILTIGRHHHATVAVGVPEPVTQPTPVVVPNPVTIPGDRQVHHHLLDQFTASPDTPEVVETFLINAALEAEEKGIRLSISHDFDELVWINAKHRDSWDDILPSVHPAFWQLDERSAFWLRASEITTGRVVMVGAVHYYDLTGSNLRDELNSMRMLFSDPERQKRPGEHCNCYAPIAAQVTGPLIWSQAAWRHPDAPSMGRLRERILRAWAINQWGYQRPLTWFAVMEDPLYHGGLAASYGKHTAEKGVLLRQYGTADFDMYLLLASQEQMLTSLRRYKATSGSLAGKLTA